MRYRRQSLRDKCPEREGEPDEQQPPEHGFRPRGRGAVVATATAAVGQSEADGKPKVFLDEVTICADHLPPDGVGARRRSIREPGSDCTATFGRLCCLHRALTACAVQDFDRIGPGGDLFVEDQGDGLRRLGNGSLRARFGKEQRGVSVGDAGAQNHKDSRNEHKCDALEHSNEQRHVQVSSRHTETEKSPRTRCRNSPQSTLRLLRH